MNEKMIKISIERIEQAILLIRGQKVLLDADLAHFWEPCENLGAFRVTIAPPPVETALLKRLGPPPFSRRPEAFIGALTLAYASVTRRALALAFGEDQLADE